MVTSDAKPLPKNYFSLKSYLKELVSEERYEYFKNKTSIKELTWDGLPVKQQIAIIMDYMLESKIQEKALIYAPEVSYQIILKI